MKRFLLLILGVLALPLSARNVSAHEGHDHGAAAAPLSTPVAPRFAARSELFEVVGVLQGGELLVYLDRAPDNTPILAGDIEAEAPEQTLKFVAGADGVFRAAAGALAAPGRHALTLTVTAGDDSDLLTATLDVGTAAPAAVTTATAGSAPLPLIVGGLALLAVGGIVWRQRRPV